MPQYSMLLFRNVNWKQNFINIYPWSVTKHVIPKNVLNNNIMQTHKRNILILYQKLGIQTLNTLVKLVIDCCIFNETITVNLSFLPQIIKKEHQYAEKNNKKYISEIYKTYFVYIIFKSSIFSEYFLYMKLN